MEKLYELIEYGLSNNIYRSIVNFRFSINDGYDNIYKSLQKNIMQGKTFNDLNLSKISDISEIRASFKDKNIKIVSFMNPKLYNDLDNNLKLRSQKNVQVNIIKSNHNSDKLKMFLENYKTSFDSFINKKKEKKKTLIRLLTVNDTNNDINTRSYSTRYYNVNCEYNNLTSTVTMRCHLILEIYKEKIITEGRLLLPNSINISLDNRSRIIFYDNNKIQVILSKNNDIETYTEFKEMCQQIIEKCINICKLYSPINIPVNYDITNLCLHCDFNYYSELLKYPVFLDYKNIKFFGRNRLTIRSITNKADLENSYNYIIELINKCKHLNNEIDLCNPFQDKFDQIEKLIKDIYNF